MMKTRYFFLKLLFLYLCTPASAQVWSVLPASPASVSFRHDDVFFINKDTGWVCNVDGKIYRTNDGGASWITLINQPNTSFRCIGFVDSLTGWSGNLGTGRWSPTIDTMPLYETNDGGTTWQPATAISGTLPKGICGINVVNDTVVYAIGRVEGPGFLLKSINKGTSWQSISLSGLATQLVDCRFFSPDTGVIVGGFDSVPGDMKYRILYTTDGGNNWQIVATGNDVWQGCWKVFFVNRMIGYVSVESYQNDSVPFLKTIDGGATWQKKIYTLTQFGAEQGIGFINDSVGWCGAFGNDAKLTTDGGETWVDQPLILRNLNRIRKINDTLAYAVCERVWKYAPVTTGINQQENLKGFDFISVSPDPFIDHTTVSYTIPEGGITEVRLYDFSGRPINTLHNGYEEKGEHHLNIYAPYYINTHFFVVIRFGKYVISQKILCIK